MPTANTTSQDFNGYTRHFERRADFVFGDHIPGVVNANIRERTVADLRVFRIADVFAGNDEIFLGFGKPNAYLTVPDGEGGYVKFAGKSLKRAPSVKEDTRGWVQSGILVRMIGLPSHAAEKLRAAMDKHHGIKYWTCVNANLRVMEDAGFSAGPRKLSSIYFPYSMAAYLLKHGLEFEGKPVKLEVVRTTTMDMEAYARSVIAAEFMTFCRHGERTLEAKAKVSRVWKAVAAVVHAPGRVYRTFVPAKPVDPLVCEVAPPLPADLAYEGGFQVKASMPSPIGIFLRQFIGAHTMTEGTQTRVDPLQYFHRKLRPFPQANPNFVTRMKKRLLFSRPMIKFLRWIMANRYVELGAVNERDIYDMLRTDSPKKRNVYNLVITNLRIIVVRTSVRMRIIDWVLSKHLLASGYLGTEDDDCVEYVLFAGETRKVVDGRIVLNGDSGTYQPTEEEVLAAGEFMSAVFPHLPIEVEINKHV